MTTEAVLLLGLFVFLLMGAFLGDSGPRSVFGQHAPMLGARVEGQLSTGQGFNVKDGRGLEWVEPNTQPVGSFK
jgi:hypothetical protein